MKHKQLRIFDNCLLKEIDHSLDLGDFSKISLYFGLSI